MERIPALEDAIEKNSLVGIYSVFYTIVHGDPNFSTGKFNEIFAYVKSKNIEGFLQEFDGEAFETEDNWNEEYWALIASSLMDNFCEERIRHLEQIGKKLYPVVERKTVHAVTAAERKNQQKIPMGTKGTERTENEKRLITEEKKRGVKFHHNQRTKRDDGGFSNWLFGGRRR